MGVSLYYYQFMSLLQPFGTSNDYFRTIFIYARSLGVLRCNINPSNTKNLNNRAVTILGANQADSKSGATKLKQKAYANQSDTQSPL